MSTYYRLKRYIKYQKYDFRMLLILIKIRSKINSEKNTDIIIWFFQVSI